jgi:hypothetical protein
MLSSSSSTYAALYESRYNALFQDVMSGNVGQGIKRPQSDSLSPHHGGVSHHKSLHEANIKPLPRLTGRITPIGSDAVEFEDNDDDDDKKEEEEEEDTNNNSVKTNDEKSASAKSITTTITPKRKFASQQLLTSTSTNDDSKEQSESKTSQHHTHQGFEWSSQKLVSCGCQQAKSKWKYNALFVIIAQVIVILGLTEVAQSLREHDKKSFRLVLALTGIPVLLYIAFESGYSHHNQYHPPPSCNCQQQQQQQHQQQKGIIGYHHHHSHHASIQ